VTARGGDSAQARHLLVPIEITGERRDQLDAKADTLDRLASEQLDPAALDSAARALGLQIRKTEPVQKGTRVQVGAYVVPDAGVWAFQAEEGEISPIIETERALFVFRLDSTAAEGVPPLASIRAAVESEVRSEKKWARARELSQAYLKRLAEGQSLADAAKAMGFAHREFPAFSRTSPPLPNPALVGAAFGMKEGERSGVIDTPEGLYVLEVVKREAADSSAFAKQLDELRIEGVNAARQQRIQGFLTSLRKDAEVEDNREELYRTNAAAAAAAAAAVPQI
jgi:hypothetical protein